MLPTSGVIASSPNMASKEACMVFGSRVGVEWIE